MAGVCDAACACCGLTFIGLWFALLIAPGAEYPEEAAPGCLGWRGACAPRLSFDGDEKDVLDIQVTGDPWRGWRIEDIDRYNPFVDWIFSIINMGSSTSGGFRLELHSPDSKAPVQESTCTQLVGRLFPSSAYLSRFSVEGPDSSFNVTARVDKSDMRLLLSPRFNYIVKYTRDKTQQTRTESTSEITYHQRDPNPWTNGLDGQALFALACLAVFCMQWLLGMGMLWVLKARAKPARNVDLLDAPVLQNSSEGQPSKFSWLHTWQDKQEERAEVRGYYLRLPYLFLPSVSVVLLLGGALSMHRERGTWGVLGCPGTEVWDGAPGSAVKCALVWHIVLWVCCVGAELCCGGQSEYRRIAGSAEECEMKLQELYTADLTLQMKGSAGHHTGSGKARKMVQTFEGTREVIIAGQQDISQRVDGHTLRAHPLVCIKVELEVRYESPQVQEAVDAQYKAWMEEVKQKDMHYSTSLNPVLAGLETGFTRLAVINSSQTTLRALSYCMPLADLLFCGWAIRMLVEFWTVHVKLKIVKEVKGGMLDLLPATVGNTLQETVQGIWSSIQGALGQEPAEKTA